MLIVEHVFSIFFMIKLSPSHLLSSIQISAMSFAHMTPTIREAGLTRFPILLIKAGGDQFRNIQILPGTVCSSCKSHNFGRHDSHSRGYKIRTQKGSVFCPRSQSWFYTTVRPGAFPQVSRFFLESHPHPNPCFSLGLEK